MADSGAETGAGERGDLIARVRELDRECNAENVERFFREMDAAAAVLQRLDVSRYALPVAYDPRWPQDSRR